MNQKTISLSKKVYDLLKNEKKEGESFSNLIERLILKNENPWLMMQNKFDPEIWEGLKEDLKKNRNDNLTGNRHE